VESIMPKNKFRSPGRGRDIVLVGLRMGIRWGMWRWRYSVKGGRIIRFLLMVLVCFRGEMIG